MLLLTATVCVVGLLIGLTGVGGVLLIPVLTAAAGLPVQSAMGTALCSFFSAASWPSGSSSVTRPSPGPRPGP